MYIGDFIKQQRVKKGLSARELSVQAGMSASYVSKLEGHEIAPTTGNFACLARALGLSALEVGVAVYASMEELDDAV